MPSLALINIVTSYATSFPDFTQLTLAFPNFLLTGIFFIEIPNFSQFLTPRKNPVLHQLGHNK